MFSKACWSYRWPFTRLASIRETKKLQIRMEAFNALNRTRFDRAAFQYGSGGFGQVTSLANGFHARQMQIVARFEF